MRALLRSSWVPFALSDESTLAAILMQACRSVLEVLPQRRRARLREQQQQQQQWRVAGTSSSAGPAAGVAMTPTEAYYSRMMLHYKGLCIRSTNESLSGEWPYVSDATICKSVIMGTEEVQALFLSSRPPHQTHMT